MDRITGSGRSPGHILIGVVLSLVVAMALCAGSAASARSEYRRPPVVETGANCPDDDGKTPAVTPEDDDSGACGPSDTLAGDPDQ